MSTYLQGVPLKDALVSSAMSKEVFSWRRDHDIARAEELMRKKQRYRLLVVDIEEALVDLISQYDIAVEVVQEAEKQAAARRGPLRKSRSWSRPTAPRHPVGDAMAA